jgi:peptidoglycan/LPS O-acetylase OafA/YrhL
MKNNAGFYIQSLDGVRGIAVLMIMFFHYELISYDTVIPGLTSLMKFGQTGVTLFFVLSGFLITRILLKNKGGQSYFKNFYIRRTLRIFPLYYFFLLLSYFVLPLIGIGETPVLEKQLPFYLFYQNISITFNWPWEGPFHYWSLAVEEHFYLFWPFVIYYFSIKNIYKIILGIVLVAILSRAYLFAEGYEVFYFTVCRMDAIALGSFIGLLEYQHGFKLNVKWKYHLLAITFIGVVFYFLWLEYRNQSNLYVQIIKDLAYSYVYVLLLLSIVSINTSYFLIKMKRFLSNTLLVYVGKISFSLYIYHGICNGIVSKFGIENFYISIIACFALAFIIASCSYYFFEMPFLKMKSRFE